MNSMMTQLECMFVKLLKVVNRLRVMSEQKYTVRIINLANKKKVQFKIWKRKILNNFKYYFFQVPDTIIQVFLEPSSETISLGDRAWFDCKVAGDPDAQITWTKEGEDELPDNAQVFDSTLIL